MKSQKKVINSDKGEIVLYQTPGGKTTLNVRLKGESLWLNQKQLSVLFDTERSVITKHLRNIFNTGELEKNSVCAKFAHTARDGNPYNTPFYNLDRERTLVIKQLTKVGARIQQLTVCN